MYRQGDVLVQQIDPAEVPAGLVPAGRDARGRLVLARGEATGHAPVVTGPDVTGWALPDQVEPSIQLIGGYGRLGHEEHGPIALPPGADQVIRQREYVPGAWRPVAD